MTHLPKYVIGFFILSLIAGTFGLSDIFLKREISLVARKQLASIEGVGSGLVGWWKLDEGNGMTTIDSSGRGNTGSLVGGSIISTTGKIGQAYSFAGNKCVKIDAEHSNISKLNPPITFSVWVNPTTLNNGTILAVPNYNNPDSNVLIGIYNGYLYTTGSNKQQNRINLIGSPLVTGSWSMITYVYNGLTDQSIYINGVKYSISSPDYVGIGSTWNIMIGANYADCVTQSPFSGAIDDVRIYDRALSMEEIQQLYSDANGGASDPTPPPPTPVGPIRNGNTITAASTAYADVRAAVALANNGETVVVPAGIATWTDTLRITKAISLSGSGVNQTVISGHVKLIDYYPDNTVSRDRGIFRLSDFTFDGNDVTAASINSNGLVNVENNSTYVYVVINNNSFKNAKATGIFLHGAIFGVISTNDFDKISMPVRSFGLDYATWSTLTQSYGTSENIYFEDNFIHFSTAWNDGGYYGWLESGMGGRIVVRYNTWDETNEEPTEYWDIHGLQNGGTSYATMVAEYYGNKIINATSGYRWMYHRGGWALMFNNVLNKTTSGGGGNQVKQYYCDYTQIQGNYKQKVTNTYFWSNLLNGVNSPAVVNSEQPNCDTDPIVEDVDFFNYNVSCTASSCSSGIGIGSQIPSGSCNIGVGFWKTSQVGLSNSTGVRPTNPISGTLYKCTAPNTWSSSYTPFTYPHPLLSSENVPPSVSGSCSTNVNQCVSGNFSDITDSNTNRLWSCVGSNGGSTSFCSLPFTSGDGTPGTGNPESNPGGSTGGSGASPTPSNPIIPGCTPRSISITKALIPAKLLTLRYGMTSSDVKTLQVFLNNSGFTVSTTGPGSKGQETFYFGPATQKALNKYNSAPSTSIVTVPCTTTTVPATTTTPTTPVTPTTGSNRLPSTFRFTRSLSPNTTSTDVKNLQIFLNDSGFTVSTTGPGSKGQETFYFGPATKSAVIRFQEYYKSEVLTPINLIKGTGLFGPASLKKANAVLGR